MKLPLKRNLNLLFFLIYAPLKALRIFSFYKYIEDNVIQPFWKTKTLEEMTSEEWESLCDRCGRCCLMKLMDEDTNEVYYTDVVCSFFDTDKCQCRDYMNRQKEINDCVRLTPEEVRTLSWLPATCAYRLVKEGKPLYPWHHLRSGSFEMIHKAGISIKGKISGFEKETPFEELPNRIQSWPNKLPSRFFRG